MKSCIFTGYVEHTRLKPVWNRFQYPVYAYCLNLDELKQLDKLLPFFGYNRFRPASIFDSDYLDEKPESIREKLFRFLEPKGCADRVSTIMLITSARYFNYVFNPVSFYYCFSDDDELVCTVAEVNNTYGERHVYILDEPQKEIPGFLSRYTAQKQFHVSPFNRVEGVYEFLFSDIRKELDIRISLYKNGEEVFNARLWGRPKPLDRHNHIKTILKHPLIPHLTKPRILWQAANLHFRRKLSMYEKPIPLSVMTIRKNPPAEWQRQCMKIILSILERIEKGCLRVTFPDGRVRRFGDVNASLKAEIIINDYRFFSRTTLGGEIGLGESFMADEWDSSDVTSVFKVFIENREALFDGNFPTAFLLRMANRMRHILRKNTMTGSSKNITRHYDLSNDFFQLFLDSSMTYSCALYKTPDESLEDAQKNKIHSLIKKAGIEKNDHVLEIGCGWGSFAMEAAKMTGCRVTGITISEAQYCYTQKRICDEGLQDRVTVLLEDYRNIQGQFDKIVSIEMLEAVGHEYLGTFFRCCDRLLKPDGLLVLQVITIPDYHYETYKKETDWIQKHIFPGGFLPSLTAMGEAMTNHSRFIVEKIDNIGIHYALTLREWRKRFFEQMDAVSKMGFDRSFRRKWLYYFSCCEAGFAMRVLGDLQIVLTRPNNKRLPAFD